jgi:hypothetical protein
MSYYFTETLSDIERQKLENLSQDKVLLDAINKVFLTVMYQQGTVGEKVKSPMYNAALAIVTNNEGADNTKLGEDLRALYQGLSQVEIGMKSLREDFLPESKKEAVKENKAR